MTDPKPTDNFRELRDFLRDHLMHSVIPFWLKHAIDESGGVNTCIRDDGAIISRDKWLWSQWRAVWVFSKLYNQVERNEEWLEIAQWTYSFVSRFGWDDEVGGWRLRLSHDGKVLDGCESIYVDGFAIYALTEFARASGWDEPIALARKTADNVLRRLRTPHDQIPHWPYPVPAGAKVHGIPMMFSLVLWELGQFLDELRYRDAAAAMSDDIFDNFYRPDRDLILERIAADNTELPPPVGTAVVPGHAIEDMWFQIHIARDRGDRERIAQACRIILRHVELGWDNTCGGGMLLAIDADGRKDVAWEFAETKLWWPQTETLYALLLAYEQTRKPAFLDWYAKLHDYSFEHYPVAEHGEWTQKLCRNGNPFTETVALPVKDPFHLPRALIYCVEVLERLAADGVATESPFD
ncbi:MAG: AGE family epimerase/isomerase [Phycisphaerae bacterium]|nr:AGE family epimerase/isomerase [Phycisphaerae bacterium]